jgi:hypothetical protein
LNVEENMVSRFVFLIQIFFVRATIACLGLFLIHDFKLHAPVHLFVRFCFFFLYDRE